MKATFPVLAMLLLGALPQALSHGIVIKMKIDDKTYQGRVPKHHQKFDTPIREVDDGQPVLGAKNPDTNCGIGPRPAPIVAPASPGSQIQFWWSSTDNSTGWLHNIGPIMTYLSECTTTTADKCDSKKAKWFKIHQALKKNSNTWFQDDLYKARFGSITVPLPQNIKAGDYLMRHEIIALHNAQTPGGAEFYASCSQIRIGGTGTGSPSPSDLAMFPGAYKDDDEGIYVPKVYHDGLVYISPGPSVATLVEQLDPTSQPEVEIAPSSSSPTATETSVVPSPSEPESASPPSLSKQSTCRKCKKMQKKKRSSFFMERDLRFENRGFVRERRTSAVSVFGKDPTEL